MGAILQQHRRELGRPMTIVDLGCGDFAVGQALLAQVADCAYIGCDIVPELIAHNATQFGSASVRFTTLDIVDGPYPPGDVCLIRQVLQHLSNADISKTLGRLDYPYVYVTEGQPQTRAGPVNPDKRAGHDVRFDWRTGVGRGVELAKAPFGAETSEMFRASAPPHEVIVTERVIPPRR